MSAREDGMGPPECTGNYFNLPIFPFHTTKKQTHEHHSITNFPCFGVEYVSCKLHNNLSRNCLNWKTQTISCVSGEFFHSSKNMWNIFIISCIFCISDILHSQQLWAQIGTLLRSSFLFWWDPNRLTHSKVYPTKTLSISIRLPTLLPNKKIIENTCEFFRQNSAEERDRDKFQIWSRNNLEIFVHCVTVFTCKSD